MYYYGARYYDARTSVWLAVDPLAEEFESWSAYNFNFNNPVKYVDLDGMKPGQVTGGDITWYKVNTGEYSSYSNPVFVPGRLRSFENPFVNNCWHAANRQIENSGDYRSGSVSKRINMYEHKNQPENSQSKVNMEKGISTILDNLRDGKPVMAGVDYSDKNDSNPINENIATDHFVVIDGMGVDDNGMYFTYVDNVGGEEKGTDSKNNRFYYNPETETFQDNNGTPLGEKVNYTLTEVRATIED